MSAADLNAAGLLEEARQASDSQQRFQLLQEAARQADVEGHLALAREVRDDLLDAAMWAGNGPALLSTFAWLLADWDRQEPDSVNFMLLWRYKWALASARALPNVPLERLDALHDDFARRTRAAGVGERTALTYRWKLALHRGDMPQAEALSKQVQGLKATFLDCRACDANLKVTHHIERGELDAALRAAKPIFAGKVSCNRVPSTTYADFLLPLWRAGRREQAQEFHERGYALLQDEDDSLSAHALHLHYLLVSGQPQEAAALYRRHNPPPGQVPEDGEVFWWHAANAHPANTHSDPAAHHAQAQAIATRFDTRNGTPAFTQRLADLVSLFRPSDV